MRVPAAALLALCALVQAQAPAKRDVAGILAGHAVALGDADSVKTLTADARVTIGGATVRGAKVVWGKDGTFRLQSPGGGSRYLFDGAAGYQVARGVNHFRARSRLTRARYYMMAALAEPFPLRPYLRDAGLARTLEMSEAEGGRFDVLVTSWDRHDVRRYLLLDAQNHRLLNVRYVDRDAKVIVSVVYGKFERVGLVELPGRIAVTYKKQVESAASHKFEWREEKLAIKLSNWRINAAAPGPFAPKPRPPIGKNFKRVVLNTGPNPFDVDVGDIDGDGELDVASSCEGGIYVHFGPLPATSKTRSKPVYVPLGKGTHPACAVEDLDLDGRAEVLTTSNIDPPRTFYKVAFSRARVATPTALVTNASFVSRLDTFDFDRDGFGDALLLGRASRTLEIHYGDGLGLFRFTAGERRLPDARDRIPRIPLGLAVGNTNEDGMADVVLADHERVLVFDSSADLTGVIPALPSRQLELGRGLHPVAVDLADLDGDGDDDLLVLLGSLAGRPVARSFCVYENVVVKAKGKTGRAFRLRKRHEAGVGTWDVRTGDMNGDGHLDAVVASARPGEIRVFYGNGALGFPKPERLVSGWGTKSLAIRDMNGDGRLDILAADSQSDTVSLFVNVGKTPPVVAAPPPRARPALGPTLVEFRLEGLTDSYDFMGEWRLPADIRDPSGITYLGGDENRAQLAFVSDKEPTLFRALMDKRNGRLLIAPRIPLRIPKGPRLDLEAIAYTRRAFVLMAAEADATILKVSLFGHVLGRAKTEAPPGNDGLEALAYRKLKDGTSVAFLFRERMGKTLERPPLWIARIDDPFRLVPRQKTRLPTAVVDQTGACRIGDRLLVVSRLARQILEIPLQDGEFAKNAKVKRASYLALTTAHLGIVDLYGLAEGLAVDAQGDLYLLLDNNRKVYGRQDETQNNRGREGRLLWFKNRTPLVERGAAPKRVVVQHILVSTARHGQKKAAIIARDLLARARSGGDFRELMKHSNAAAEKLPDTYRIVQTTSPRAPKGWFRKRDLPVALGRAAFGLKVGEVALVEYHKSESPRGFHLLKRIE